MYVTRFLQENKIDDLTEKFGIDVKKYDDRYVLNYNQIKSYKYRFHPIVRECRALILDKDFNPLMRSFDRFFNLGEEENSRFFPIVDSTIDEKLDGSLIGGYFDNSKWCVSTRKSAFAEVFVNANPFTFRELIEKEVLPIDEIFKYADPNLCYIFELVSPYNRVVTPYNTTNLYLLAVRNKKDGTYIPRNYVHEMFFDDFIKLPKTYSFKSKEEIEDATKDIHPLDEGWVCEYQEWRIKIKNPAYLVVSKLNMNGSPSSSAIIELVSAFEETEFLSYYPEYLKLFEPYLDVRDYITNFYPELYKQYKDIEEQKDFAIAIKNVPFNSILFSMRNFNKNIHSIINDMTAASRERIYEYFKQEREIKNDND